VQVVQQTREKQKFLSSNGSDVTSNRNLEKIACVNMPKLETLQLNAILMGIEVPKALANGLRKIPTLQRLILRWGVFNVEGLKAFSNNLPKISTLNHLELRDDRLKSAAALGNVLSLFPNLRTLCITGDKLEQDTLEAVSNNLHHLENLHTLELRGAFKDEAIETLFPNLQHLKKLHTLELRGLFKDKAIETLFSKLTSLYNLRTLKLGYITLEKAKPQRWFPFLITKRELKHIELKGNKPCQTAEEDFYKSLEALKWQRAGHIILKKLPCIAPIEPTAH